MAWEDMIMRRISKERLGSSKSRLPSSKELEDEMDAKAGFMATLMEK